ncbi:hypothetical protein P280DRAFT_372437, partial [Massarina eburnea CBS 473.64]
ISDVVPTQSDSDCVICSDSNEIMRKLRVCDHVFGEECLEAQLGTYHPNRYKCALCRRSLI